MMSAAVFTSLLVCAAGTAAILPDPRAQEATGTLRILVIRATWGPKPEASWTPSPFADAAALYARSSFGKLRLAVEVTPWLVAYREPICPGEATPSSVFGRLGDDAQDAARGAGFDAATFARVVYVLPDRVCGFGGLGVGREVLLASAGGILDAIAFAHELGHTFGLAHANGSSCARGCRVFEYGDPLSPMGGGSTDFTALEKLKLRWISRVERGTRNGTYTVADIDAPSERPQALVVETAPAEFWLEHRRAEPAGVIVRVVRPNDPVHPVYLRTLFLSQTANRYVARGIFRVTRTGGATFAFEWLDRRRPTVPRLGQPGSTLAGVPAYVSWRPARDAYSGVAVYRVAVDGRHVATTSARGTLLPALARGRHRVAVTAVDRAGNRSRATVGILSVR
jgi:Gametolysin peptidase M11